MVPDNWNFNGSNPCLYHGGNYNQNQNHGPFYVNYNRTSNSNDNIGWGGLFFSPRTPAPSFLSHRLTLHLVVGVPHPFYIARLTAQHLLKKSRQDTA